MKSSFRSAAAALPVAVRTAISARERRRMAARGRIFFIGHRGSGEAMKRELDA
jgi:hypothetical protein